MIEHKRRNKVAEATGKLVVTARKRRELAGSGLLSAGGRAKVDPLDDGNPTRDRAAFVRALLGR